MHRINTNNTTQSIVKATETNDQKKVIPEKIKNALNHICHYINCLDADEMEALINYLETGKRIESLPLRISQQLLHLESISHNEKSYFMHDDPTAKKELVNILKKNLDYLNRYYSRLQWQYQIITHEFNFSLESRDKKIGFTLFHHLKLYYEGSDKLHPGLKYLFDDNKDAAAQMYSEGKKIFEDLDNKGNVIFISHSNNDSICWTIEDPGLQDISDNIFEL